MQKVKGTLKLATTESDQQIKVAVARDQTILASQVLKVAEGKEEIEFELDFRTEGKRPVGVRLLAGPNVVDERLGATEPRQAWLKASAFDDGVAHLDLEIAKPVLLRWFRFCRTHTVRGRVVCRHLRWDEQQQMFVFCDAPVRGAEVTAFDVDRCWWWSRQDRVGSAYTDQDGFFEITFRWCCWPWRPWHFDRWALDPDLLEKIREAVATSPRPIPLPDPDPVPDFAVLRELAAQASDRDLETLNNLGALGGELRPLLPESSQLHNLHVWPWCPFADCRPDIIFSVEQDCGEGPISIYSESTLNARWDIPTTLDDVVLLASHEACCAPSCEPDPPDGECLAIQGVGCGSYPIGSIEQAPADPLAGYANPGSSDRLFGGTIPILGVFGDGAGIDFYKPQRRRLSSPPTGWADVPPGEISAFLRRHWIGPPPPFQKNESVQLQPVDGELVLKTVERYQAENADVNPAVPPTNFDRLFDWRTAANSGSSGAPQPGLVDGLYELRFIGYEYDEANDKLTNEKVMPICQAPGEEIDPSQHATILLRLDNRVWSSVPGNVHLNTQEPDCDIVSVTVDRGAGGRDDVQACGFARVEAGDVIRIRFRASDSDLHLGGYRMTAHWGDGDVFNVLSSGTTTGVGTGLVGPGYGQTFLGAQGAARAALPAGDPERDRPAWAGGLYEVAVTVGAAAGPHQAFETCCAYQLDLRVWKRTTNGCTSIDRFHTNHCEYSFTVIRTDLIGDPAHPGCTSLCEDD